MHCGVVASSTALERTTRWVLALLPLLLVVVLVRLALPESFSKEVLRDAVAAYGAWGPVAFVGLYVIAVLGQLPGSIVVAGGVLLYGPWWGGAWCYVGALASDIVAFGLVRYAPGARTLVASGAQRFREHRAMKILAARPLAGVIGLRLLVPTAAMASAALALSPVSARTYVLGSAIGIVPQLVLTVAAFGWALSA